MVQKAVVTHVHTIEGQTSFMIQEVKYKRSEGTDIHNFVMSGCPWRYIYLTIEFIYHSNTYSILIDNLYVIEELTQCWNVPHWSFDDLPIE